jgi:hypothetical protein
MSVNCIVLDLFFPSTGTVAFLDFSQGVRPFVGMTLANDRGHTWEITKYGMPILISDEIKYKSNYGSDAIWDCTLRAVNHSEILKINDNLVVQ